MIRDPVLPIPEEVCTSVHRCSRIEFRTLSPAEYSIQLDLGRLVRWPQIRRVLNKLLCRKMCEVASFKNFENSLTTVKVMTKTKVAPFYLPVAFTQHAV